MRPGGEHAMAAYVFYPALFDAVVSNVKKHSRLWE